MNNEVAKAMYEIKVFGLTEFIYHFLCSRYADNLEKKYKYMYLYLKSREDTIESMNEEQRKELLRNLFLYWQGIKLSYDNPTHFTEKIQYLKLFDTKQLKTILADKYLVREWIKEKIGEKYLIPIIGVWTNFDEIDFALLPDRFCLKANHGSGMNIVVHDKGKFDTRQANNLFNWWLKTPFWSMALETHYKGIKPKIIAEQYIEEFDGNLKDYKIHCFNGEPNFIQCIGDRDVLKHTGRQMNYSLKWEKLGWTFADYPDFVNKIEKPRKLDEMIKIARILAEGFEYVRVDLYEINGEIYFGEMTFTPACGVYPYKGRWTEERDIELGKKLLL